MEKLRGAAKHTLSAKPIILMNAMTSQVFKCFEHPRTRLSEDMLFFCWKYVSTSRGGGYKTNFPLQRLNYPRHCDLIALLH